MKKQFICFGDSMTKALVLIDFEQEWIMKDSENYVGDISSVLEKTNTLIDFCRLKGYKIIFTTHVEEESEGEFAPGSDNVKLISELHKESSDVLIEKNRVSPFFKTSMEQELQGVEEVVVCGILTNLCVRSFVQDAYDRDFAITVIKDCCVSYDEKTQQFTFDDLKATREEVEFKELDDFLKS